MRIGIIGLPNAGKSTIFNALAGAGVEVRKHPFTTIEPNVGMAVVADPRLDELARIFQPEKVVPAAIRFVDVAGLVEGASRGEGLGNQFLAAIRETDALAHTVRCFPAGDIAHVFNEIDPVRDAEVIRTELFLADLEQVERKLDKLKSGRKSAKARDEDKIVSALEEAARLLGEGKEWRRTEAAGMIACLIPDLPLLSLKPVVYLVNCGEDDPEGRGECPAALKELARKRQAATIAFCGKLEAEIMNLPPDERDDFRRELGVTTPGLPRLVRASADLLGLITFFTKEGVEVRAWMTPRGTPAAAAAGMIHTDMATGFIKAEVASFIDLKEAGSIGACKEAGCLRLEGRDYPVQEGDVIRFFFHK